MDVRHHKFKCRIGRAVLVMRRSVVQATGELDEVSSRYGSAVVLERARGRERLDNHAVLVEYSHAVILVRRESSYRQGFVHHDGDGSIFRYGPLVVIHDDILHRVAGIRIAVAVRGNRRRQVENLHQDELVRFLEHVVLRVENDGRFQILRELRERRMPRISPAHRNLGVV